MGFLVPLIAPALAGTIGGALLGAGLSVAASIGLGYVARKLTPKPKTSAALAGTQLQLRAETNVPYQVAFGETATAGSLSYWHLYGPDNEYLQMVFPLADHECEALTGVYVSGKPVTVNPDGTVVEYPGVMWIKFHSGAWDQAVDQELVDNSGGRWTANDRGRGVCYVRVTMKYDEKKFPGGRPSFLFQFRGAKLYDWRKDSTNGGSGAHRWGQPETYEYSENPVVAWYNWRRGIWRNGQRIAGMNTPATAIDHDDATAAANICDEQVALKIGGTETRYRISALLDTSTNHRTHIENMLGCMAGEEYDLGGIFRIMAGAAQSPVLHMTDDDLLADAPVKRSLCHTADKLTNAFFGSYREPEKQWNEEPLDPRLSPADETADGGDRLEATFDFPHVRSNTQGQRVLEALRRQARRQETIVIPVRARLSLLEPGDWITWTSERYGFVNKTWQIGSSEVSAEDHSAALSLREIDADVNAWVPINDEITPGVTQPLPSGGPSLTTVSGLAVANATLTAAGGAQRPALRATWTPITDPTVDGLKIQYRRVGETDALTTIAEAPADGVHLWPDGIQGGVEYEIRAIPVTTPQRALNWTSWVQVPAAAANHVVDVAMLAQDIPPASIDKDDFIPTLQQEISLITADADVDGSIAHARRTAVLSRDGEDVDGLWANIHGAVDAFIENQERIYQGRKISVKVGDVEASVATEALVRATDDTALATQITSVEAKANGATAGGYFKVEAIAAPVGVAARLAMFANAGTPGTPSWEEAGIYLDVVAGVGSQIFLKADKVKIGDDTDSIVPFTVENGVVVMKAAAVDIIQAGIIRSADGKMVINLDQGAFWVDD